MEERLTPFSSLLLILVAAVGCILVWYGLGYTPGGVAVSLPPLVGANDWVLPWLAATALGGVIAYQVLPRKEYCVELRLRVGGEEEMICSRLREFYKTLRAISSSCTVDYVVSQDMAILRIRCRSSKSITLAVKRLQEYEDIFTFTPCGTPRICVIQVKDYGYTQTIHELGLHTNPDTLIADIHGVLGNTIELQNLLNLSHIINPSKRATLILREAQKRNTKTIVLIDPTPEDVLEIEERKPSMNVVLVTAEPSILAVYPPCKIKLKSPNKKDTEKTGPAVAQR